MNDTEQIGGDDIDGHELFVEMAPFWQELTCPGCGATFPELVGEKTAVAGSTCPGCHGMIHYRFDRSERSEDTTEQAALVQPDGPGSESDD